MPMAAIFHHTIMGTPASRLAARADQASPRGDRAQIVQFCVSGIGRLARQEDHGVRDGVGCAL